MIARNTDVPVERRLEFRMGVSVGDIIIEDGDIFDDGVNIAARLALCQADAARADFAAIESDL
jgi:adenylate cyclase